MLNIFSFNDAFKQFTPQDFKEINEMSVPTIYQAELLLKHWANNYDGESSSNEAKIIIGKTYAKCVQRCKQVYPELFI